MKRKRRRRRRKYWGWLAIPILVMGVAGHPYFGQGLARATPMAIEGNSAKAYLFIYFLELALGRCRPNHSHDLGGGSATPKRLYDFFFFKEATPRPIGLGWPNSPQCQTEVVSATSIILFYFIF